MQYDRRKLTRLISRLENSRGKTVPSHTGRRTATARVIGITGPPGVGKSTLIDRLIEEYRRRDKTVAVIAVDPTSRKSGGALLGDRVRMQRHSNDPGVFIRSLASRTHRGGLTGSTPRIVDALDAAGFDVILIETIGTGQDEIEIADVADTVVLVLMPEMGDEVQRAKAGLMEIADIIVINKSDLFDPQSSPAHVGGYRLRSPRRKSGEWERPTLHASAKHGEGIAALCAVLDEHHRQLQSE